MSARLVNTIGTVAPTTMAAALRVGQIFELLGEHLARFEIWHDENVGAPRDDQYGVIERERAVEDDAGDLAAVRNVRARLAVSPVRVLVFAGTSPCLSRQRALSAIIQPFEFGTNYAHL